MDMKSSYWHLPNWEFPCLDWSKLLTKSSTPSGVGGRSFLVRSGRGSSPVGGCGEELQLHLPQGDGVEGASGHYAGVRMSHSHSQETPAELA